MQKVKVLFSATACVEYHYPFLHPLSVKDFTLSGADLYIPSWEIFCPDRIAGTEIPWRY